MKNFYVILFGSLLMLSCSLESEDLVRPFDSGEDVVGRWEYFEYTYSTGSSKMIRERVESGVKIEFLANSELVSVGFFECDQASYQIEGEVLRIDFDCEAEQEELQYRLSWEGENLVLVPISPTVCIEGCSQIFRRASNGSNN